MKQPSYSVFSKYIMAFACSWLTVVLIAFFYIEDVRDAIGSVANVVYAYVIGSL